MYNLNNFIKLLALIAFNFSATHKQTYWTDVEVFEHLFQWSQIHNGFAWLLTPQKCVRIAAKSGMYRSNKTPENAANKVNLCKKSAKMCTYRSNYAFGKSPLDARRQNFGE